MSYILEALKKSDQERKRGDVPGLQTVHIPLAVESKSHRLLYVFIAVLLLALAFVLGLLLSGNNEQLATEVIQYDEEKSDVSRSMPLHQPANKESLSEQTVLKTAQVIANPGLPVKETSPSVALSESAENVGKVIHSQLHDEMDIPYLHELPEHIQQAVPHMGFAGHVFSSTPSSRSVIINGASMSEGDTIIAGLAVEQITASGVIFKRNGELFRVDILQDWSFD